MEFLRLQTSISSIEYQALIDDADFLNCLAWVLNDTLFLYGDSVNVNQ